MSGPNAAPAPVQTRFIRLSVFGLTFGLLLSMLDSSIVGTALPTIVDDLGGGYPTPENTGHTTDR